MNDKAGVGVTHQQYQDGIPNCCALRTNNEHFEVLGWCWGLLSAIENNRPMDCSDCEFATKKSN